MSSRRSCVFNERKELPVLEAALAPVLAGGIPDAVPPWVLETVQHFWHEDTEPVDVISDEAEPGELERWADDLLTRRGIGRHCCVATHLSIKPWLSCVLVPGWARVLRAAIPDPVVLLAEDYSAVIGFIELEYHYAIFAAAAP